MNHDSLVITAEPRSESPTLDYRPLPSAPGAARWLLLICWSFLLAPAALAQLTPIKPAPGWQKVPSGTRACSVEKSCEELAPAMIRSAQGASPFEGNLRELTRLTQQSQPISSDALSLWVAEALRRAGVERVHTEKLGPRGSSPADAQVVVGEIIGREKPNEFVVLSAHLDDGVAGDDAADDPADAAVVIDAARVIRGSGSLPRRSMRFVILTGRPQRTSGLEAYLTAHRAELDSAAAAVLFGIGNKTVVGFCLNGRKDILAAANEALAPVQQLDAKELTLNAPLRPDSLDFVLEGIPTLVANASPSSAALSVRTDAGNLDAATLAELKRHVAIAAVATYALTDAPQRIGPRQPRASIEQLLQETGLAQEMKREDLWTAWENGERGRPRSD